MIEKTLLMTDKTFDKLYFDLISACLRDGETFTPRKQKCVELRPYNFCLTNPRRALYNGVSRKLFFRFYAIETLGYIAGLDQPWYGKMLASVNKQFEQYLSKEGKLHGAYGPKICESILDIVDLFGNDINTRQAVMSIWSPGIPRHPNLECTLSLQFFSRTIDDKKTLCLNTCMRSNDLNWGTPYDVPAFCAIQILLANVLNLEYGHYYHNAGSLHVYAENLPDVLPFEKELWITNRVRVPHIIEEHYSDHPSVRIRRIIRESVHFLSEINFQRINGKPWSEIEMPNDIHYTKYFKQWLNLIRFRWQDQQTSTQDR